MKTFPSILLLSVLAVGDASLSFVPHRKVVVPTMHQSVFLRGGAGPLDPELTSQVTTIPVLLQGLGSTYMPEMACDMYGYDKSKPLTCNLMRGVGNYITQTGTLLSLLLFKKDLTPLQCVGYTWLVGTVQGMFIAYKEKCDGMEISGHLVACAIGAGT